MERIGTVRIIPRLQWPGLRDCSSDCQGETDAEQRSYHAQGGAPDDISHRHPPSVILDERERFVAEGREGRVCAKESSRDQQRKGQAIVEIPSDHGADHAKPKAAADVYDESPIGKTDSKTSGGPERDQIARIRADHASKGNPE